MNVAANTKSFSLLMSAFGQYKWQIAIMAVATAFSGVLEGIGITAVVPLFSFIDKNQIEAVDIVSKVIKNFFFYFGLEYSIKYLLIFIAALFIAKSTLLFISQFITVSITADYQKNTRSELMRSVLLADWPYLSKQKVGHLDQILISNVTESSKLLSRLSSIFLVTINLIIYSLLVINMSFRVALLTLVFGIVFLFGLRPWFYKTRVSSKEMVQESNNLAHYLNESLIGIKSIKAMFAENQIFNKGREKFENLKKLQIKIGWMGGLTRVLLQPIGVFFIIAVFSFFYKTGGFNFASFAVSVYAINKVFENFQSMQSELYTWNASVPSLFNVLKFRDEARQYLEKDISVEKFHFNNVLEFKDTVFAYNSDGSGKVLSNISFIIKKGEMVGIFGSSGAGKTTIVDLLLRLYNPQGGVILIDGVNISGISLKEWRTNIGYVSQDVFLINDTILNNIRFYNESLSHEDVAGAAKMANIYDFIQNQPDKFETIVGERGLRLSGGERQRIVLARVLARKPKILIMDEATSALDNESESLIQKAIEGLKGQVTIIAIAHRLSTIINFDKVIALAEGKIIEEGPPHGLLKNPESYFYKMHNLKYF